MKHFFIACLLVGCGASAYADLSDDLKQITLPPGFRIDVYAEGLTNPRQMALGDNGTLFIGSRTTGNVYAVVDTDGDFKADKQYTLMTKETELSDGTNPSMPSGLAFRDGSLYVGAVSHILRFDDVESKLESPGVPVIVTSAFPDKRHHGWKSIAFGPDGKLYVPVGAPCNTCPEEDDIMNINRINPDGSGLEVVARGVRNTVGFDWHPETGELWFTDNGVDGLGDDMPADELNRVTETGQHFGFPYVHQGDTLDQRYGKGKNLSDYVAPAQKLLSHTAALGMKFYTGSMFPEEYKNVIFIAEHGSWNSSEKHGYRVMMVREKDGVGVEYEPFATGWLDRSGARETAWGRPCDVLLMPDGSMLISDTETGAIYRVSYRQ